MKCDYINLFIYDYIDGYLSKEQSHLIESHTLSCESCRHKLIQAQCQKQELRNLKSPGLSQEFTTNVLENTEFYYNKSTTKSSITSPYLFATAASILLVCVLVLISPNNSFTDNIATIENLSLNHQEKINMVFDAPKALQNVQFTVILPENTEMLGHPGKKQVIWFGHLKAGRNLLSVPILTNRTSSGVLTTKLNYERSTRIFKVRLDKQIGKHIT